MRLAFVLLLAFLAACDPGVAVTYRVSMASQETDSISQLSVTIADAVAQQHAMQVRGTSDGCSLAYYYRPLGGGGWLDLCVTRGSNAVRLSVAEFLTYSWGAKGDALRHDLLDTLTAQFGARVSQEK